MYPQFRKTMYSKMVASYYYTHTHQFGYNTFKPFVPVTCIRVQRINTKFASLLYTYITLTNRIKLREVFRS